MTLWNCSRCGEEQIAFAALPDDRLCHACHEARAALSRFTEADAGVPERYRRLTRESWSACFQRPWPASLEHWAGEPHWVAIWGPTGTGKTGLATVLLAEHLRTGKRGRWISGPELSRRIQRDFTAVEDVIAPLLSTSLLVFDEPLTGAAADWYTERLLLITRTRDERGLPTIVTSQLLPELLAEPVPTTPPPILSRWLSGIHVKGELGTMDIRLKRAL
jgi:hypothetical protein